jgi:hypothetical protein
MLFLLLLLSTLAQTNCVVIFSKQYSTIPTVPSEAYESLEMAKKVKGGLIFPTESVLSVSNEPSCFHGWDCRINVDIADTFYFHQVYIHELGHYIFKLNDISTDFKDVLRRKIHAVLDHANHALEMKREALTNWENEYRLALNAPQLFLNYSYYDKYVISAIAIQSSAEECFADLYTASAIEEADAISEAITVKSPKFAKKRKNSKLIPLPEKDTWVNVHLHPHELLASARTYLWRRF